MAYPPCERHAEGPPQGAGPVDVRSPNGPARNRCGDWRERSQEGLSTEESGFTQGRSRGTSPPPPLHRPALSCTTAPCYKARPAPAGSPQLMTLVSIPANPVPDDVVAGTAEDPRRRRAALCALGAAARPQGHGLPVPGPRRIHREIFRDRARPARARLRGRDARLARAGPVGARAAQSAQGLCAQLLALSTSTSKPSCSEVVLPDCPPPVFALAPFDGRDDPAARRLCRAIAGSTAWCCWRR